MNQIHTAAVAGKDHVDREPFDAMMEQTPDAGGVTDEQDTVGGVSGVSERCQVSFERKAGKPWFATGSHRDGVC